MDLSTRRGFLNAAAVFEGGGLLLGLLLGVWAGTLTPERLSLNGIDTLLGMAAVIPMLGVLVFATRLRQQALTALGAALAQCRWYDLAALAILAGVGEELLFRGVLEPWIGRANPLTGMVVANLLFGLVHAVSWRYVLFASLTGVYFSLLAQGWSYGGVSVSQNLLRPIVAHSVYDFIAFLVLVRDYRQTVASTHAVPHEP